MLQEISVPLNPELDVETSLCTRKNLRRPAQRGILLLLLIASAFFGLVIYVGAKRSAIRETTPLDSSGVSEFTSFSTAVYPVRMLLFRHGFSCSNAGYTGGCADPNAPILHFSETERQALFDTLDEIGSRVLAPQVVPQIDRRFGIEGPGRIYSGGDPPLPDGFKGDDCMLHLKPWTDNNQWHEAGNIIQMHHFYRDAALTDCSKFQSEKAGEAFRNWLKIEHIKIDFLGASMLSRTFQTAHYELLSEPNAWPEVFSKHMLKGKGAPFVAQLPFLNEFESIWGYQADNFALPQNEQRTYLVSAMGSDAVSHLDYSQLTDFNEEERAGHDWKAFTEKVLVRRLIPSILKRKGHASPKYFPVALGGESFERTDWGKAAKLAADSSGTVHPVLNIAMASHSGIIHDVCNFTASNNAVVEVLLLVEARRGGSEIVVRQQRGCTLVMDAPKPPESLDIRDVANCKHPFAFSQAFVRHTKSKTERTSCEEVALAVDAYPTAPAAKLDVD